MSTGRMRRRRLFDIRLMKEGKMKGQAFVTLPNESAAKEAIEDVNGFQLHGRPMVVHFARSAKPKEKDAAAPEKPELKKFSRRLPRAYSTSYWTETNYLYCYLSTISGCIELNKHCVLNMLKYKSSKITKTGKKSCFMFMSWIYTWLWLGLSSLLWLWSHFSNVFCLAIMQAPIILISANTMTTDITNVQNLMALSCFFIKNPVWTYGYRYKLWS